MNMQPLENDVETRLGQLISLELWRVGAVQVNVERPFRLVSGRLSPIYVNCRALVSSTFFIDLLVAATRFHCMARGLAFDVLAGGETAGIPFAAFLAHALGKPMCYVRKAPKDHGLSSRIEGSLSEGAHVLLVEDLITDAGSKLSFVEALRKAGAHVSDVLVVFDRQQGGSEALSHEGISLHSLTDLGATLELGEQAGILAPSVRKVVTDYLADPTGWSTNREMTLLRPDLTDD
jgi:orotate phosphoribosyltransferase